VAQAVTICRRNILALPPPIPMWVKERLAGVCEKDAPEGAQAVTEAGPSLCHTAIQNSSRPLTVKIKQDLMRTICDRTK
jgi:hypothetical protein